MRRALRAALAALLAAAPVSAAPGMGSDALLRDHLFNELRAIPKGERPTVGLVLSAGSLRAAAHVGVITVLEDAGFPVDVVSGTSMGAIVGSLYAAGWPIKRMWEMGMALDLKSGTNFNAYRLFQLVFFDSLLCNFC